MALNGNTMHNNERHTQSIFLRNGFNILGDNNASQETQHDSILVVPAEPDRVAGQKTGCVERYTIVIASEVDTTGDNSGSASPLL